MQPVHAREEEAKEIGLMMLDELPFEHAVYLFDSLNIDAVQHGYRKAHGFLQLCEHYDAGLTVVASPNWMFVAPIFQPYHLETMMPGLQGTELEAGVPVYLDGFAYAGIVNIQEIIQSWPESTGGVPAKTHGVLSALTKQSQKAA